MSLSTRVNQTARRMNVWRDKLNEKISRVIEKHEVIILNYNRIDQLYNKGIGADGNPIGGGYKYSPVTVQIKKWKHQPYDRVTLRDTGAFTNAFTVYYASTDFSITSRDSKTDELIYEFGPEIFGLTQENIIKFAELYLKGELVKDFKKTFVVK